MEKFCPMDGKLWTGCDNSYGEPKPDSKVTYNYAYGNDDILDFSEKSGKKFKVIAVENRVKIVRVE